jgi:NAD(P)-dependent dehydrogenase (short-subunit alcohol dehydrogenase family)
MLKAAFRQGKRRFRPVTGSGKSSAASGALADARRAHTGRMTGRIALITGASRGLGRSIALHLARGGTHVIGTYLSRRADADAVVAEIEGAGSKALMLPLNVGESATFPAFAASIGEALRAFGREQFDILVNNAGAGIHAPFATTSEAQFDELFRIHVKAPFFLTQALLPLLADGGRILNVSTGLARFTSPGYAAYASAKGAVEVLTRYMAKELGTRGIRVNVVAPGAIESDFGGGVVRDNADLNRLIAGTIPLGRVGLPDDIGRGVAAILSDGFAWANGTRIELSGGQNI